MTPRAFGSAITKVSSRIAGCCAHDERRRGNLLLKTPNCRAAANARSSSSAVEIGECNEEGDPGVVFPFDIAVADGMADIQVRPAFPAEEARWRASRAKAIRHGNIESEDDTWIAFLVALTDLDRRRG